MTELRFDRGTILVRAPDAVRESVELPGLAWDGRVGEWRAPAHRHGAIVRALRGARVPLRDLAPAPAPPPPRWREVPLRPYQRDALDAWRAAGRRGVVALPTGAGKTRIALGAIAQSRVPSLVLVPTRVLLDQWRLAARAFHDGEIGLYGDGDRTLGGLTIATFDSARLHMESLGARFPLLVIDEAHHFAADGRSEALEMSLAPWRLGLTATPPPADARAALDERIGPVVYERSIADLAGDALAPFDLVELRVELAAGERAAYEDAWRRFSAFRRTLPAGTAWRDLAAAAARTPGGREALAALRRARGLLALPAAKLAAATRLLDEHRDRRALLFTSDNAAAYALSRALLIPAITCEIRRDERDRILGWLRDGAARALVSARVLNEGLDVPDADLAIVLGGALGTREHVQRVGRVLRPRPGKRALVYEVVVADSMECGQARRRREGLS